MIYQIQIGHDKSCPYFSLAQISDIAASFQEAVVESLINKVVKASKELKISRVGVVGGVAANIRLRQKLRETGIEVYFPTPDLCTDNGVMVALCAKFYLDKGMFSPYTLQVNARASV